MNQHRFQNFLHFPWIFRYSMLQQPNTPLNANKTHTFTSNSKVWTIMLIKDEGKEKKIISFFAFLPNFWVSCFIIIDPRFFDLFTCIVLAILLIHYGGDTWSFKMRKHMLSANLKKIDPWNFVNSDVFFYFSEGCVKVKLIFNVNECL